jgi:hypothetical protein
MGKLSFSVPHSLSKDEAKKRLEQLGSHWAQKYGLAMQWQGDAARIAGKIMGVTVEADLRIEEGRVSAEAKDPGFLFREKAKSYVSEKLTKYLGPNPPTPV